MRHPLYQFNYCPICGARAFVENNEKSKRCESCGFVYYFNPSAAVACFIRDEEGRLLLVELMKKDPDFGEMAGLAEPMLKAFPEIIESTTKVEIGLNFVK